MAKYFIKVARSAQNTPFRNVFTEDVVISIVGIVTVLVFFSENWGD